MTVAPALPRVDAHTLDVVVVAPLVDDIAVLVQRIAERSLTVLRADEAEAVARDLVGGRPEIVVVDLRSWPDGIGDRILTWVSAHADISALALSNLTQSDARIRALALGCTEHLVAPFDVREGLAWVELLLARQRTRHALRIEVGDITVDVPQRSVIRNGERVTLTPRELALLQALFQRRDEPVSKQELLCTVWRDEVRSENVVEANVSSLRRKLHGLGPPVIHTVHRGGYVFRSITPATGPARTGRPHCA